MKPLFDFDLNGFLKRTSKVGAERATIEAVTSLLQVTHKALTAPRPAKARPKAEKPKTEQQGKIIEGEVI